MNVEDGNWAGRIGSCEFGTQGDPKLSTAGDHGGPTSTLAPGAGSVAIGAMPAAACQADPVGDVDQRGFARRSAQRGGCDAGSYDTGGDAAQISSAGSASARVGDQFSYPVTATGFPAPTFSLSGAPSWLSIDAAGGVLSGTVPSDGFGVHTFDVLAHDPSGADATQSFTLTVTMNPMFTSADNARAVAGQPFTFPVSADGYPPVSSYTLTGAPTWLSIDPSTGSLFGTPPDGTAATSGFTVTAGNGGFPGFQFYTLTVSLPAPVTVPGAPTIGAVTAGNASAGVAFTAPATDGGAPITKYTVTSSPGAKTCATSATTCTVIGLTNGTSYRFTATAANVAGTSAASTPSAAVTPRAPTALVLSAATASVGYGSAFTVSGRLTRTDTNVGLAGATVQLQYRMNGSAGDYSTFATTARTSASGTVDFSTFKPAYSTQLRLTFAAAGAYAGSTSSTMTSLVNRTISIHVSAASVKRGGTFAVTGSVGPSDAGNLISLQRKSGSQWVTAASVKISSTSTYGFSVSAPTTGTFSYRTATTADSAFTTSVSPAATVKVT